jgi:hypothetical protein
MPLGSGTPCKGSFKVPDCSSLATVSVPLLTPQRPLLPEAIEVSSVSPPDLVATEGLTRRQGLWMPPVAANLIAGRRGW